MDRFYLISLFDIYKTLLTHKQRYYFIQIYYYDQSLSEVANSLNISRSAVYDAICTISKELIEYENKLHLKFKFDSLKELVDKIDSLKLKKEFKKILF